MSRGSVASRQSSAIRHPVACSDPPRAKLMMESREKEALGAVAARAALASQFGKWQADANSGTLKRRAGDWYGRNRGSGRTRRCVHEFPGPKGLMLWKGGREGPSYLFEGRHWRPTTTPPDPSAACEPGPPCAHCVLAACSNRTAACRELQWAIALASVPSGFQGSKQQPIQPNRRWMHFPRDTHSHLSPHRRH